MTSCQICPGQAQHEAERLAKEIATRESMVFVEGASYTGPSPGVRTETGRQLMLTYVTDVRGELIVLIQVSWFG